MVIVAILGSVPTSGYGIVITHVERHGNTVKAQIQRGRGPGTFPVVTNPYHIIECKKAKHVDFIEK
jgi:hypothetical protein